MEFRLDSHTHTLASGHAYCTLLEMVRAAADRGLELICITDHAPGMELTTHKDYFLNFRVIDREIYGVRVMMGAELNVMDFDGTVDLSPKLLNNLDMAIASQHIWCMPQGGGPEENTAAMVRAMDNCPRSVSWDTRTTAAIPWTIRRWCGPPGSAACFWRSTTPPSPPPVPG